MTKQHTRNGAAVKMKKEPEDATTINKIPKQTSTKQLVPQSTLIYQSSDILYPRSFKPRKVKKRRIKKRRIKKSKKVVLGSVLKRARCILLQLLKEKDYKSSLALLAALVETSRYNASVYWKVGKEIIQQCQPDALTKYLDITVVGVPNEQKITTLIDSLIYNFEENGYAAFKEKLENDSDQYKDPAVIKLIALLRYEEWKQQQEPDTTLLELMKKVYEAQPSDRHIIMTYLEVLSKQIPRPDDAIEHVVQTCLQKYAHDPEIISMCMFHGSPFLPKMIELMAHLCKQDPVADSRLCFLPLLTQLKLVQKDHPYYMITCLGRAKMILTRLEYGGIDLPTLDELDSLLHCVL
ncbi:hypothetical protein BC941DRAFT_424793 [Chlamydoabsidia padenii]|nr:hypothetical protein BC941DRAFT_424793 [Chlamydoabsidia padenii]